MAPRRPHRSDAEDSLLAGLTSVLGSAGWTVAQKAPGHADLVTGRAGVRYVGVLRSVRETRRNEVLAALADALLRARGSSRGGRDRPLALVAVPAISDRLVAHAKAYAEEFFDGDAWGLLDHRGQIRLFGPGLDGLGADGARPEPMLAVVPAADPFSDLGQWMCKVLLARRLPPHLLDGPREPIRHVSDLARAASVSLPTASRFVASLRGEGYLARGRGGLEIVRIAEFMERWQQAIRRPSLEVGARWIFPSADPARQLDENLAVYRRGTGVARSPGLLRIDTHSRACLGLFAACEALGVGFVHGAPRHAYVDDVTPDVLEEIGLVPAAPGERVDVWVRKPRFPETVFRGAVKYGESGLAADVLQCWLDVADHPVRGAEQAESIYRRVIQPCLLQP